ncbi:MAG: efflux RND transporter periplasmic adaptor subunit [Blastocatellia bacterium]|nr:efflux RND transporter periplasmic adaptor subunit [Blastocatellia bacterium]
MNPNPDIRRAHLLLLLVILVFWQAGCGKSPPAAVEKPPAPATVTGAVKEADLATIKLTAEAETRLGIELATVEMRAVAETRTLAGEVVLPPDRAITVAAPISGTIAIEGEPLAAGSFVRKGQPLYRLTPFLAPERDLRLQLERETTSAATRTEAARVRLRRAEQLLQEKAGSEKSVQQAQEELALAENDLTAARARLTQFQERPLAADASVAIASPRDGIVQRLAVAPGQSVNGGAALVDIASYATLWLRVPVYVGDLSSIDRRRNAQAHDLNGAMGGSVRAARPVSAPPTADAVSDTADLYFELSNADGALRPGQKLGVTLAVRGTQEGLVIPWAAILYDIHGGAWVYENTAPHSFTRRRVEVARVLAGEAVLQRGPAVGAKIVRTGGAELFGTEFGAGK